MNNNNQEISSPKISSKKKERTNYFLPFYGEDAQEVVELLSAKGENSFPSVQRKLNIILHAPFGKKEYKNALYAAFELNEEYNSDQIIQEVSQVRSSLGLEPYANVKSASLDDFHGLFINKNITNDKRKVIAYQPIFKLRPE